MKLFIMMKTDGTFDEQKLTAGVITFWEKTIGRYDYIIYCSNVTTAQALNLIENAANDPAVQVFTPLIDA